MASAPCWSLLIGARRLKRGRRTFSPADERLVQDITTRHFPAGYTILRANGGWFDPRRRRFVREESRQVLICGASLAAVRRWGRELGAALQQQELVLIAQGRAFPIVLRGESSRSR